MRIDWNTEEFKNIRYGRTSEIVGELEKHGERVAATANANGKGTYVMGSRPGVARPQGRHRVSVVTGDAKAMIDNARHNTLIRALGSG